MLKLFFLLVGFGLASAGVPYGRIADNNDEANILDYPYQVTISKYADFFECSGSLVSSQHVITAANCVPRRSIYKIEVVLRFGNTNRFRGPTRKADNWIAHPKYTRHSYDFDVGFFTLKKSNAISLEPSVMPIALITKNEHPTHGDKLTVVGWIRDETRRTPDYLRAVQIGFLGQNMCNKITEDVPYDYTDNMFCAGGGDKKVLNRRDLGAGIINENKKLVGITSWGSRPLKTPIGYPEIFTDITSQPIRDFIDDVIEGRIPEDQYE